MKVLNLTTHLNSGGITVYILRLIDELRTLGIEYSVASSGGNYEQYFVEKNCSLHEIDIQTKNAFHPKVFFAIPKILRIIKKEKIDVIHAHTRVTQVLAFFIQFFVKIPVITTAHGFYKAKLGRKLIPAWGNYCVAISQPVLADAVNKLHADQDKMRLVHNAVDISEIEAKLSQVKLSQIHPKENYGFKESDVVIGVVARLVKDKGHEYLLEAFRKLNAEASHMKLLITGSGKEYESIKAFIKKHHLEKHAILTGNIPDVSVALAAIDIFVFPATWREGFGLSIVEAMCCEIPVIVTNIWALNSWIEDGKTGIMIPPMDSVAIEKSVKYLIESPEINKKIGRAGKELVLNKFNLPRMAKELQSVYNEALTAQKASI